MFRCNEYFIRDLLFFCSFTLLSVASDAFLWLLHNEKNKQTKLNRINFRTAKSIWNCIILSLDAAAAALGRVRLFADQSVRLEWCMLLPAGHERCLIARVHGNKMWTHQSGMNHCSAVQRLDKSYFVRVLTEYVPCWTTFRFDSIRFHMNHKIWPRTKGTALNKYTAVSKRITFFFFVLFYFCLIWGFSSISM